MIVENKIRTAVVSAIFVNVFLFFFGVAASAQNIAALSKTVGEVSSEPALRHATLAVSVYDLDKKTEVYAFNSQRSVTPASLTKLVTTAVGFDKLGSGFRFRTLLAYSGDIDQNGTLHGDIYIIGGGDPLLGSYRYRQTTSDTLFDTWCKAVSASGIRAVDGRVYYDATIFDNHPINDAWLWSDIGNYYGVGASGLNFHENMFFIYFTPAARIGYPAKIDHISPKGLSVHPINEVMTGPARSGDRVVVYGDPASSVRICTGTMPVDSKNFSVRASLPKPGQTCADLFTLWLRGHKIPVSGAASQAVGKPSNLVTLLEYTSPTYDVVAQYTNVSSNNTYAEAIFKYLGYKAYGLGSHVNGGRVVNSWFHENRLETSGIKLEDGCGLSVRNRITADFMCRFLIQVSTKPYYRDFISSLAVAGEGGTAQHLLTNLPRNVKVKVKTGSMTGVRAYAGYVSTADGKRYCFTVVCNDYECTGSEMKSKLEKVLMKIATL